MCSQNGTNFERIAIEGISNVNLHPQYNSTSTISSCFMEIHERNYNPNPGKPAENLSSYRPISLLSILSKLFEKLFKKRIQKNH